MSKRFRKSYKILFSLLLFTFFLYFFMYSIFDDEQRRQEFSKDVEDFNEIEYSLLARNSFQILSYKKLISTYLYSAFVDMRQGSTVRIFALVSKKISLNCQFFDEKYSNLVNSTDVEYYEMSENHNRRYKGHILSCPIPDGVKTLELKQINIIANDFNESAIVRISDILFEKIPKNNKWYNFTLCTPVIHGDVYSPGYLIEFIEISLTLGAQHVYVYFYEKETKSDVLKVLEYYANLGILTYIRVDFYVDTRFTWNYGQSLVVQDCLYRNVNSARFTLFYDLDEHFVPYVSTDWHRLSEYIFKTSNEAAYAIGSYSCLANSNTISTLVAPNGVECTIDLDHVMGKCIVRPSTVFEMGIHHVSRLISDDFFVVQMNSHLGAIHHYRGVDWRTPFATNINSRLANLLPNIEANCEKVLETLHLSTAKSLTF